MSRTVVLALPVCPLVKLKPEAISGFKRWAQGEIYIYICQEAQSSLVVHEQKKVMVS